MVPRVGIEIRQKSSRSYFVFFVLPGGARRFVFVGPAGRTWALASDHNDDYGFR